MALFNATPLNNQISKFGPSVVSYFDETVGELSYLSWTDIDNNVCIAQVFLGDEITFGKVINLNRKSICAPSLSVNPFICDGRVNISWIDEHERKVVMASITVGNASMPKYLVEAEMPTVLSPTVFPFFPDPVDKFYRNESCFIYKDGKNNINWSASSDGINYSSKPVYIQDKILKSLTAPTCVDNNLIWTDYETHQLYAGNITNNICDGAFLVHIENAKRVGGMSAAGPAAVAIPANAEIVLCYRGHTYKQLFVQILNSDYHSVVRQTQLGVESDFSPAVCSFNNTPWIAWTDKHNNIQLGAIDFDKCRAGFGGVTLVGLGRFD